MLVVPAFPRYLLCGSTLVSLPTGSPAAGAVLQGDGSGGTTWNPINLSGYAPLNSPSLTGVPLSTTPISNTDNSTQIATTAWVNNFIAAVGTSGITVTGQGYLSQVGSVITANAVDLSGANVTGTLGAAHLPNPGVSSLGGVRSIAAASHQFLTAISTSGIPAQAQPSYADISGLGSMAQQPASAVAITGGTITGLGNASASSDALPYGQALSLIATGVHSYGECDAYFSSNVTISAPGSLTDGSLTVSTSAGTNRILLTGQTTSSQNGPWLYNGSGSALTRPVDYAAASAQSGGLVYTIVGVGSSKSGWAYVLNTSAVTVDTTATTWGVFSSVVSGSGMITVSSGVVSVSNGAISNTYLANSSITLNSHAVSLGGSLSLAYSDLTGSPFTLTTTGSSGAATFAGGTLNIPQYSGGAFSSLTGGTNTAAAMVVGSGASLSISGSGTIAATSCPASALTGTTLATGISISSLTQVGTIGVGVWQGSPISPTYITTGTSGANIPLLNGANVFSGACRFSSTLAIGGTLGTYDQMTITSAAAHALGVGGTMTAVDTNTHQHQHNAYAIMSPTSGALKCTAFEANTTFAMPAGQTVTWACGLSSSPVFTGNIGTITNFADFYADGAGSAVGTITNRYSAYFTVGTAGSTNVACYTDNLAVGTTGTAPPASGILLAGQLKATSAGGLSTSVILLTSAPYSGGNGTTCFPQWFANWGSPTAQTNWSNGSNNGTVIGGLGPSTFTGNWIDLRLGSSATATPAMVLTYAGKCTFGGAVAASNLSLGGTLTTAAALTVSGAYSVTLTATAITSVTLPTSGTLVNTAVTALSSLTTIGVTSNGLIKTTGGAGALSVATSGTDYQAPITLTTTGTSGAATFVGGTLNIPQYSGGGSGYPPSITVVTGTSQAMSVNNSYIANNASLVTCTLPSTAVIGSVINVGGLGAGGWSIAQNTGQQIYFGSKATTAGTSGSIASNNQYDNVTLQCVVANTTWVVQASQGNMLVT